MAVDL
jgi:hypothetical protein